MNPDFRTQPKAAIKSTGAVGNILAIATILIALATTYTNTGTVPTEALTAALPTLAFNVMGLWGRVTASRPIGGLFSAGKS